MSINESEISTSFKCIKIFTGQQLNFCYLKCLRKIKMPFSLQYVEYINYCCGLARALHFIESHIVQIFNIKIKLSSLIFGWAGELSLPLNKASPNFYCSLYVTGSAGLRNVVTRPTLKIGLCKICYLLEKVFRAS